MFKYVVCALVLALTGCSSVSSIFERHQVATAPDTEQAPVVVTPQSVQTAEPQPQPTAKQAVVPTTPVPEDNTPIHTIVCQQVKVATPDQDPATVNFVNQTNIVATKGKLVIFLAGSTFQQNKTFTLEPLITKADEKLALGWANDDVAGLLVTANGIQFMVHEYNVPVDKSFNGETHNTNIVRHVYLDQCK